MIDVRSAWLIFQTRDGEPYSLHVYSEPAPTLMRGRKNFVVAKTKARDFTSAERKLKAWWSGRRAWQKRALLANATQPSWTPIQVQ